MRQHRVVAIIAISAAVLVLGVDDSSSEAKRVPLDRKVAESDFIGIVRVLETEPLEEPTEADARWPYQQFARAEILRSLKGPQPGKVLGLEFDNGLTCPNATYIAGAEYFVFWRGIAPQRYATYNFYYGQFPIENDRVMGWDDNWSSPPTVSAVVDEIQRLLVP